MNSSQITKVMRVAQHPPEPPADYQSQSFWDLSDLFFHADKPHSLFATAKAIAPIIRYQAMQLNGEWDQRALQEEVFPYLRRNVVLIEDEPEPEPLSKRRRQNWTNRAELDMALAIKRVFGEEKAVNTLAEAFGWTTERAQALLHRAEMTL